MPQNVFQRFAKLTHFYFSMGGSSENDSVAVFWHPIYSQVSALKTLNTSYTIKSFAMWATQHPREGSSQSQSQETPSIPHGCPIRL